MEHASSEFVKLTQENFYISFPSSFLKKKIRFCTFSYSVQLSEETSVIATAHIHMLDVSSLYAHVSVYKCNNT